MIWAKADWVLLLMYAVHTSPCQGQKHTLPLFRAVVSCHCTLVQPNYYTQLPQWLHSAYNFSQSLSELPWIALQLSDGSDNPSMRNIGEKTLEAPSMCQRRSKRPIKKSSNAMIWRKKGRAERMMGTCHFSHPSLCMWLSAKAFLSGEIIKKLYMYIMVYHWCMTKK